MDNMPFLKLPSDMDKEYRLSQYNLYIDESKGLVYNTRTTAIVEFDDKLLNVDQVDDLLDLGILIPKNSNEIELIKSEYNNRERFVNRLHLIIAVTLDCQFRCFYCYENHPQISMSDETVESIYILIRSYAEKGTDISIDWYGGEPLLAFETIVNLTQRIKKVCSEFGVKYTANIISNGLLMTPDIVSRFSELSVDSAQITLDGTKNVHDKRRRLIDGQSSFETIFNNIAYICNNTNCMVTLRINVDKDNIDDAYNLIKMYSQRGITGLDVTLGMLKAFGCGQQCDSCGKLFSMEDFSNEFLKFREFLKQEGFVNAYEKMQPKYKINSCTLDAPDSFVIDPEGYMYKCISYVGRKDLSIGNINESYDEKAHDNSSPFESEVCTECVYLPICKGACLHYTSNNPDNPQCDVWKYITEKLIKIDYCDFR